MPTLRRALKLRKPKSLRAFDSRDVGAQRIQASTNEFPVPDTLFNSDIVAALPRLRRYARVLTGDVHRADDLVPSGTAIPTLAGQSVVAGANRSTVLQPVLSRSANG